ncbi:hypothetical protein B484DRAFT_33054 [Ochromonadaceae sp. CCMP2298]|nr:hypothetical protein B484DRAFT_33054 [Ochromonadaceae sp. CCMP2298]
MKKAREVHSQLLDIMKTQKVAHTSSRYACAPPPNTLTPLYPYTLIPLYPYTLNYIQHTSPDVFLSAFLSVFFPPWCQIWSFHLQYTCLFFSKTTLSTADALGGPGTWCAGPSAPRTSTTPRASRASAST